MRSVSVFLVCCEANCYRMMWCRAFSNPVMSALSFPNMVGHGIYTRWGIIFVIRIYRPGFESCPILLLCPTHTFSSCEFTVHLLCPTYCTGSRKMMLILPVIMIWYIYIWYDMIWYGLTLREKTTPPSNISSSSSTLAPWVLPMVIIFLFSIYDWSCDNGCQPSPMVIVGYGWPFLMSLRSSFVTRRTPLMRHWCWPTRNMR